MRAASIAIALLSACSPAPRDAAWFEANPQVAERVVEGCHAGDRSLECENARRGLSKARSKARLERYRRGFE